MTVSKEMIKLAKETNLINFLIDKYPEDIIKNVKDGTYRNKHHDSLVINPNAWYRFSTGDGGDTIQYLMEFQGKSFQDAVMELFRYQIISSDAPCINTPRRYKSPSKSKFEPNNVINYLTQRGIAFETIQMLFKKGVLYEDNKRNAVFCRTDKGKEMCVIKGTDADVRFNKIITKVPDNYWYFSIGDNPEIIYVCESPIDAISLYECNQMNPGYYVSMNGLKPKTMDRIVQELGKGRGRVIKIGVDWDKAGIKFYVENGYKDKYSFMGAGKYKEKTKDWNEVLQLLRSEC